ncbi:uncharacterized protein LOC124448146, partial [Xenia sp. Carnegie-2017]|uniref:uncharacterized protein LOC124448146 n=1 Tax=Xenia sp. Carnegie-2017 TaxID=2897299 RepID=UPI001F05049A
MMCGICLNLSQKKLTKKANIKGNDDLTHWIKSNSNHLWWCSASCNKNAEELVEKWKSVLNHISNKHFWKGNTYFHQCCHQQLTERETKQKKWLSPTSQAYIAAEKVICDKRLLKDLRKLSEFCHTGELEVYHSFLLKYCPKQEHFSFPGMLARTQLAALDHNNNINHDKAVIKSGTNKGQDRYKMIFAKTQKQWAVKAMKEKK